MTNIAPPDGTQRAYARAAGFLYLFQMAAFIVGDAVPEAIRGSGEFADVVQRVLESQHLYGAAMASMAIGALSLVVLSHALYVVLAPVNQRIAQLALWARLGEAFIVGAIVSFRFAALRLYESSGGGAFQPEELQVLLGLIGRTYWSGLQIWLIFFWLGSTLFFYLFLRSRYIPRPLAILGLVASSLMLPASLAGLIFPEYGGMTQYMWAPMFVAEVATGLWLLIRGIRRAPVQPARAVG